MNLWENLMNVMWEGEHTHTYMQIELKAEYSSLRVYQFYVHV